MGLLKNITHHIKQSNKPWSFFAESIGIHKDDIENIGKNENPDKEFVHAFTRKIWSEILEVGDIKYQDYSHYTEISSVVQLAKFSSGGTDAANGAEAKTSTGDKVEDDFGRGHGTIQDIEDMSENKDKSTDDKKDDMSENKDKSTNDNKDMSENKDKSTDDKKVENVSENKDKSSKDKKENKIPLAEVVQTDNFNLLRKYCCAHHINIATYRDEFNNTLIHIASAQSAVNILQILMLRYFANSNVKWDSILWRNKYNATPLHIAVMKGNLNVYKVLIKYCPDQGSSAIYLAAQKGLINIIKYFCEHSEMSINLRDDDHMTLLHYAVDNNHIDVVKYLVEKRANINTQDIRRQTPLHYAIYGNNVEIVSYLVNNGAEINPRDVSNNPKYIMRKPEPPLQPLILAAMLERVDIMKILLDSGADINIRDNALNGDTALHKSIQWNKIKACKFLCDNGVDVNARNSSQETALCMAVKEGDLDICKLLCYKGADINIKDSKNETALEKANRHGYEKIVNFFKTGQF